MGNHSRLVVPSPTPPISSLRILGRILALASQIALHKLESRTAEMDTDPALRHNTTAQSKRSCQLPKFSASLHSRENLNWRILQCRFILSRSLLFMTTNFAGCVFRSLAHILAGISKP